MKYFYQDKQPEGQAAAGGSRPRDKMTGNEFVLTTQQNTCALLIHGFLFHFHHWNPSLVFLDECSFPGKR